MALASNNYTEFRNGTSDVLVENGIIFGNYTQTIGRKRVIPAQFLEGSPFSSPPSTVLPKRPGRRARTERLHLESLPQDILVRILCCVEHDDLMQLFHVSKAIREAAHIAEKTHFAFSTPSKSSRSTNLDDDFDKFYEEAPNAPRQQRCRSRLNKLKLAKNLVALFSTP